MRPAKFLPAALGGLVCLIFVGSQALGQFPEHRLQSITPTGAEAGQTIEMTVTGTDLEGLDGLRFDHPGLRSFQIKGPTFRVAIAPGTPPGPHSVRLQGRLGISNPRVFVVGGGPEQTEIEPNNTPETANPLVPDKVVNGQLNPAPDVDYFTFDGTASTRVVIDVSAGRLDSKLSATLRLFDPSGREIAGTATEAERDPVLDVVLPADGRYVLEVHDVVYAGSPEHSYRLSLGTRPRLLSVMPLAAVPGVEATFTVYGRGLQGTPVPGMLVDGHPVESRTFQWTPAGEPSHAMGIDPLGVREAGRRGWLTPTEWLGPEANRLFIAAAEAPVMLEVEPNGPEAAQAVTLPCEISAAFATEGDADVYQFAAKKGDVWRIEATAEESGSIADSSFVIQKLNEKGEAQDLAAAQDVNGTVPGFLLADRSNDTWLRWQVPEDGTYRVFVNDLYGSQRGDARLTYRLLIRPERPDFRLFVMAPGNAAGNPSGVTLRSGGRAIVQVMARRFDDYTGPIYVEATGLPAGVTASPCFIGTGQYQATLILTAAEGLPDGEFSPRFVGRMRSGDRKDALNYDAGKSRVTPEQTHEAVPMTWVRPPIDPGTSKMPETRAMREFVVALRGGAPFELTAAPAEIVAGPGESVDLSVSVARRAGFVEAVALTVADLPPNLPAPTGTIAKDATAATLKLTVPANVAPGTYTLIVHGTGPFPFAKDPNAKDKPNVTVNEPSNPIILTVRRP
jgi:hypothetical protein